MEVNRFEHSFNLEKKIFFFIYFFISNNNFCNFYGDNKT